MGDRVSIQYGDHWGDGTERLSAVLKDHWGGPQFPELALTFANNTKEIKQWSTPLSRKEPDAIMCFFVHILMSQGNTSLRLVCSPEDCDNSDNGHFIVWLDSGTIERR